VDGFLGELGKNLADRSGGSRCWSCPAWSTRPRSWRQAPLAKPTLLIPRAWSTEPTRGPSRPPSPPPVTRGSEQSPTPTPSSSKPPSDCTWPRWLSSCTCPLPNPRPPPDMGRAITRDLSEASTELGAAPPD